MNIVREGIASETGYLEPFGGQQFNGWFRFGLLGRGRNSPNQDQPNSDGGKN